jgi:hypothetical protein
VVTGGAALAKILTFNSGRRKVIVAKYSGIAHQGSTPAETEQIIGQLQAGSPVRFINAIPASPQPPRFSPGQKLLLCFAGLLIAALVPTLIYYWTAIITNGELLIFAVWLFLTMIGGMFVQVIVDNYQAGHPT